MSDSTPATECTIPQPGPSAEHDRRADESLSLLIKSVRKTSLFKPVSC